MVTKKSGRKRATPKSEFSARNLQSLIRKVTQDPGLLEGDWRDLVRGHFKLSDEQERSLADAPSRKVRKINKFLLELGQYVREGKQVTGKIVKRSLAEQKKTGLVYDVDVDFTAAKKPRNKKR